MASVFVSDWEWEAFRRLPEAVRRGGSVKEDPGETPLHPWWETFATSITGFATPAAEGMAAILAPWAADRNPLEVLDVACGNGLYAFTLARRQEHARLTLLDWPNVIAITRDVAEQFGLRERTRFIDGDMFEVALGGPYHLIIASHVFHHFSEQRCVELLRRLAGVLEPDGRLAIQEFLATDSRPADEPFPRLFSVLMLVWTREGEAHSLAAYERMLAATGFDPPELHEVPGLASRFLIAQRTG